MSFIFMRVASEGAFDWTRKLVVGLPQYTGISHDGEKPARKFPNSIFLAEVQGLRGQQPSPQADGTGAG